MRTPKAVGTNPKILIKVRENTGYDVGEVAKKISTKVSIIRAWESGEKIPTFKQLSKLSSVYRYPSAFFFANEIPLEEPNPTDYRTMPNRRLKHFPEIKRELKDAYERREIALELIQRLGYSIPKFTLKCSMDDDHTEVALMIRKYLGITIEEQLKWKKDEYTAFKNWRSVLEKKVFWYFNLQGYLIKK